MMKRVFIEMVCLAVFLSGSFSAIAAESPSPELFARKNLVAWCIVPFDSKKRGPEERAAMLEKLGFSKFAYDYRAEHIPTFDAEIEALKKHHIELTAWWFPTVLNDEAKMTLAVFQRQKVTPQLWVTGGGERTKSEQEQRQRIVDEAARIRPIAEAAQKVGCKVALYNHGGWFGEPENQIAIIQELKLTNVGIVYNQHHGHDHLDRFPGLLQKMKPYLYVLNLNGMVKDGDRKGQKILQLGEGNLDLELLKIIQNSGYTGPIGILGHTSDDAEARLHDNLDGLDWLLPQLAGKPAGPKPKMRTPIPAAAAAPAGANANVPRLTEGKFGKALDGRAGGAYVASRDDFRQLPITVECWAKLIDKQPYNILVAHELKSSGTHWEMFSMAGSGNFTVYVPGFAPDHCHSKSMICDGKWHHLAMILEAERIRLFVDGQSVADQVHHRTEMKSVPGGLALGSLVDQQIGWTGLLDEVRISRGVRSFASFSEKAFVVDESTLSLWRLDELFEQKQFDDATRSSPAVVGSASTAASNAALRAKIEGHWGEDALGFRWTEEDSRDDRFGQMDTGPFFSGSITGPGGTVYKGIVVRLGANRTASICYDTELMRASAGWNGFLKFDAARFGIIVPPRIEGDLTFSTPLLGGWSRTNQFSNFREYSKYGGLPKSEAHYEGLYRHGNRMVLKFTVGSPDPQQPISTLILESPWLEESNGVSALSRTLQIGPSTTDLSMIVAEQSSRVRLIVGEGNASLSSGPGQSHVLVVPAHSEPVTVKLLIAGSNADEAAFDKLVATSPKPDDLAVLTKPGPIIWGEPLVTKGELSNLKSPFVIDTITLPFENRFHALMFCGGHDFLPDGRAFVCTLHGDVWLVDGIDESLKQITWRRFATGLFQPLGLKLVPASKAGNSGSDAMDLYVVGRDQITRLHDLNGDGEADYYENFNNDAYVSLNGHEYVTSLETDRAGNFYYVKGNCDSAIPHDGSLLRVTPDGSQLEVYATGFRNSNGIGIGPHDEITVAPQEGEWTPASGVFAVRQGGFYGAMMSHHQSPAPTDFERPFCWFPRLADNSCGGQVWVPADHWGPLASQLLHLSYGQCELRLLLREELSGAEGSKSTAWQTKPDSTFVGMRRSPLVTMNGGSTELPMTFASGIHRGRFNRKDGHLYLTGLKGWVTSAVNDGCFQRVRYTGRPVDLLVGMKTYHNGIALTFTRPLNRDEAVDTDNYQLEAWNYHWSAAYGSADLRPSAPGQIGRDPIEPKSVTLLDDNRTVFIEIPDLKPVDQLGVGYSLHAADGAAVEETAYLTINGVPDTAMPEAKLHRSKIDLEKSDLLARLEPGVLLSAPFLSGPKQTRLMAWNNLESFEGGSPTKEVIATGYLKVPMMGVYRFNAKSDGPAQLEINGETYALGDDDAVVRLRKGLTPIRVHQSISSAKGQFRLMWESDRFPRETIPATALFHEKLTDDSSDNYEKIIAGRSLFAKHKCAQCHLSESNQTSKALPSTMIENQRHAPQLHGIGSRLNPDWLAAWLRNPTHVRPDATMPAIVELQNDQTLGDLVAFLGSLGDDQKSQVVATPSTESGDVRPAKGAELFERLGCIACHKFAAADEHPEWNRVSLEFVKHKFKPGELKQFLRSPHRNHVGTQMPDFHLSEEEARALVSHLEQNAKGVLQPASKVNLGHPERGKKLFVELRCDRCHQASPTDTKGSPNVHSAFVANASRGCLSDGVAASGKAPTFKWTDGERQSLKAFLAAMANGKGSFDQSTNVDLSRHLKFLRCTACHARDAGSAAWPEIVSEEGSGKMPEIVPQLTWVGEKLQGPWISKILKGQLKQKTRPWITARMPSFPEYADLIAHSMSNEHGLPFDEPLPKQLDGHQVEVGQRLTLRDGGLDCRQCHGVGKELPRGDVATQIALGINFAIARDRLRPEFVRRQLLDPPRYDVGSRMPRFAPDLKTTAAKQIEGGDARKQFDAIESYIWSIKSEDQ